MDFRTKIFMNRIKPALEKQELPTLRDFLLPLLIKGQVRFKIGGLEDAKTKKGIAAVKYSHG